MPAARLLSLVLILAVLAVACSENFEPTPLPEQAGGDNDGTATVVPFTLPTPDMRTDEVVLSGLDVISGSLVDGPVDDATKVAVTAWFDSFLEARGRYYLGQATIDDVRSYTSDRALLAELPEWQDAYVQLLDAEQIIATKEFASFSNPSNMVATRGRITFDDCTEQQALSVLEFVGFRWITQRVTLAQTDDAWSIVELDIVHDGEPWTPPYGCAPDSFEARALTITESLMQENLVYQRDPSQLSGDSFAYFEEPQMRNIFVSAIEAQRDEGIHVVSPEEWRYDILGLNVGGSLLGWAVAIDVCSYRPDGILYTVDGSDEVITDTTVEPGFSLQYRITTLLEQVSDGITPVDKILAVEITGDSCW